MSRRIDPVNYEKFFASRHPRAGRSDRHVPSRRNDAGALPAYRFDDRAEIQECAAAAAGFWTLGGGQTLRMHEPGRRPGPARRRRPSSVISRSSSSPPTPFRQRWPTGARKPGFLVVAAALSACVIALMLYSDHPADQPAEPGSAAAAGIGKAAARHRAEQHDAGPRAVRRLRRAS